MGFIYRLTSPSGKSYIGQTVRSIEERFKQHQQPDSECVAISRAIQKYGWGNMKKEWQEVSDDKLNFYEEMLVALLGTLSPGGYNLREGGGSRGSLCEDTKQKITLSLIGKTRTDETKKK
ncbi:GIY-YIG catalytic domain-containing endonuclease [Acanthocystis turfacea Chlorella virus Br0604L]|nr:GIY-YIG catalytic domain-containing endonuclease [Acanthocystis turfacea Chlorella virus Br0604L]